MVAQYDDHDEDTDALLEEFGVEEAMPFALLRLDNGEDGYQRAEESVRAKKIAASFDARLFGRVVVNRRSEGFYYILDGQHRYAALKLLGATFAGSIYTAVPCIVFTGLSHDDEESLFHDLNVKRKPLSPYQLHRSNGEIGRVVDALLAKYGLHLVDGKRGSPGRGSIAAVQTIYSIYRSRGLSRSEPPGAVLDCVLDILTTVWAGDEEKLRVALQKPILLGLHVFLLHALRDDNFDPDLLLKVLRNTTPQALFVDARAKAEVLRYSIDPVMAQEILRLYNKATRYRKLTNWAISASDATGNRTSKRAILGEDEKE